MTFTRRTMLGAAMAVALATSIPASAAKPVVIGFSQVGAESEWRSANTASIKQAASAPARTCTGVGRQGRAGRPAPGAAALLDKIGTDEAGVQRRVGDLDGA